MSEFNIKEVKVHRTLEGNIFELIFLVMMIAVWVLIIQYYNGAPNVVPIHFDAAGRPTSYDSKASIIFPCIIITIAAISMMVCAYFPRHINMPFKITNIRQVELAIRMARIFGLVLLALAFVIGWTLLGSVNHGGPSAMPILSIVGLLVVITIVFTILIQKAK